MKSKRRALRFSCGHHQVSYKTAYDAGEAVLLNVSTVGCAFEQPSLPLSMQEKVLVSIALLGEDSVIQAQGVVVRVENGFTAICFTLLETEDQEQLIKYFAKKMRKK
ncbi:PilZ domain-containing protein [Desulfocastanea catecholica]